MEQEIFNLLAWLGGGLGRPDQSTGSRHYHADHGPEQVLLAANYPNAPWIKFFITN